MEIILSKQCESLTGAISTDLGYFLVNRKGRFFSQRSRHSVPPDGHWRFILTCANLAQPRLYLTDIRVPAWELADALHEAYHFIAERQVRANIDRGKNLYNAHDIINLKITFSL